MSIQSIQSIPSFIERLDTINPDELNEISTLISNSINDSSEFNIDNIKLLYNVCRGDNLKINCLTIFRNAIINKRKRDLALKFDKYVTSIIMCENNNIDIDELISCLTGEFHTFFSNEFKKIEESDLEIEKKIKKLVELSKLSSNNYDYAKLYIVKKYVILFKNKKYSKIYNDLIKNFKNKETKNLLKIRISLFSKLLSKVI